MAESNDNSRRIKKERGNITEGIVAGLTAQNNSANAQSGEGNSPNRANKAQGAQNKLPHRRPPAQSNKKKKKHISHIIGGQLAFTIKLIRQRTPLQKEPGFSPPKKGTSGSKRDLCPR